MGRRNRQSGSCRRTAAASRSRCSRSRSRWWAETCAPSVSSRARTSCSSTGAPRSRETRAWVSRSMLPRGARIQPSRRPPQKLLLALPRVRVSGANDANGRGIDRSSSASAWCASSTTAIVRDAAQVAGVLLALGVGHQVAGGVLEVRDQVGQRGRVLPQPGRDRVEVPAVGIDRGGHQPGAPVPQRLGRVGVHRRLDLHPLARGGEGLRHDRDGAQCARGHHDLAGVGRQPPRVVRRRDRLLERRQPGGVVAVPGEVGRQVVHRGGVRLGQARAGTAGPRS